MTNCMCWEPGNDMSVASTRAPPRCPLVNISDGSLTMFWNYRFDVYRFRKEVIFLHAVVSPSLPPLSFVRLASYSYTHFATLYFVSLSLLLPLLTNDSTSRYLKTTE